jgi:mannose-6-phosphate isomerase-like protein (cupin superfamily)
MAIIDSFDFRPMVGDPDDHRPNTTWTPAFDPESASGYVRGLTLLFERIAVGDRIPLHTHPIDEVIVIERGTGDVRVGEDVQRVNGPSVVFIPAGAPHGTRNAGDDVLHMHAIFESPKIGITYLERNPAPGTEADAPAAPAIFDARQP